MARNAATTEEDVADYPAAHVYEKQWRRTSRRKNGLANFQTLGTLEMSSLHSSRRYVYGKGWENGRK